ncbi:hypothetical protein IMSHALPRED_006139 [Imshaugia aleurites]|uniref:RING-type domain-containing protein n=1 Tax=Imshaugia aleurites TaxID=172621 RepID=A0A8H3IM87_9LECA|nr:hypothetical protein IMSHALPRED_006139 [Imshaugia aleurites]
MAKCGHIFCLPCLIRFMHSSDDSSPTPEKKARWKKCPICWDSIYISETRPVRWFTGQEGERPQEGADVVLRLIMRQPGSTLALPRDGAESLDRSEDIPWFFAAEVMDYARVMKGSEAYMTDQYDKEIEALQQQEKEDELMFGEETQWTRRSVSSILEAKERIRDIGNPPSAPKQPSERKPRRPLLDSVGSNGGTYAPDFYSIQHAAKSGQSLSRSSVSSQSRSGISLDPSPTTISTSQSNESVSMATISTESRSVATSRSQPPAPNVDQASPLRLRDRSGAASHHPHHDSPVFFYEALMHYYLSPLDIRILRAAFGDYSSFPTTILPRVERVSTGHIIDDELRRRAKYLAHLPHGCEVGFLECNWTDVVSPEVLEGFAVEIERRRKKNREKELREEKERVRAEKEEDDKRWAAARRRRPTPSQDVISDSDFQPLPDASAVEFAAASSSPPWSSSRAQGGSGFASLASPSTSPAAPKTVWGTRMIVPASPDMPAVPDEYEPSENDGWLQDWERDLLQEGDLVAQVEASSLEPGSSNQATPTANNKKKKGRKITLMSTSVRRGA